jgi:uncharacterized protein YjdB
VYVTCHPFIMRLIALARAPFFCGVAFVLAACGGGGDGAPPSAPETPRVSRVDVSPPTGSVTVGQTLQLSASALTSSGQALSRTFNWTSSDATKASVSATGLVTAVREATSLTVTATADGISGTATLVIAPAPVATVEVTVPAPTVIAGQSLQATVVVKDASGSALTGRTVAWSSGNSTVATVSTAGLISALTPGTAQITATSEGRAAAVTLQVLPVPVATVSVSLPSPALNVEGTYQLTTVTRDASGATLAGRPIAYSSSAPATVTVSASGLVTAVAEGTAVITATAEGRTGTLAVTVAPRLSEWTVMVYLAGDNNLAREGVIDLNEMEARGSNRDVRTVVQAEYSPAWLRSAGVVNPGQLGLANWNTFRYEVPSAGTFTSKVGPDGVVTDIGNRDMTRPQELREFIEWAKSRAPAKRYVLVLWNHGDGPSGLLQDETSAPEREMSLSELRSALTGGPAVDIVDFDMCLMGTYETVVALRGVAKTAVFSEEVVPGQGSDYREIIRALQETPTADTRIMAGRLVDAFFAGYTTNVRPSITKSAVDVEQADAMIAATSALATTLRAGLPGSAATISQAALRGQNYAAPYLRDFRNTLDSLRVRTSDAAVLSRIDATRSSAVSSTFMLRNRFRRGTDNSARDVTRSTGLAILWPSGANADALPSSGNRSLASYAVQLNGDLWADFLGTFLASAARAPMVDLGALPLQAYLVWDDAARLADAEVDLLVFEPYAFGSGWNIYTPALGSVSPNGVFTPDSYESDLPFEGWSAKRFVTQGKYYFIAWLYGDPRNIRPAVNIFSRLGFVRDFTPLYTASQAPRLSLSRSWLDDPNLTSDRIFGDAYTDLRVIGTWTAGTPSAGAFGMRSPEEFGSAALRVGGQATPTMTPEQQATLRRLARDGLVRSRAPIPIGVREQLRRDLSTLRNPR